MNVGDRAPAVNLLRTDGSEVSVRELTGGRPAVLYFLRHYG